MCKQLNQMNLVRGKKRKFVKSWEAKCPGNFELDAKIILQSVSNINNKCTTQSYTSWQLNHRMRWRPVNIAIPNMNAIIELMYNCMASKLLKI